MFEVSCGFWYTAIGKLDVIVTLFSFHSSGIYNYFTILTHTPCSSTRSKPLERRALLRRRETEPGLDKDLLHVVLLLVEGVVHLIEVLEANAVGNHLHRCDLLILDHLEERFPVEVDGCLAVANEADAALHEGADVEVVGLDMLDRCLFEV